MDLTSKSLPLGFPHCSPMVAGNQGEDAAASAGGRQGRSSLCEVGIEILFGEVSICSDKLGVSENSVPLNPMVNDHYPVFKWLFHWECTQHFQTNPIRERTLNYLKFLVSAVYIC